MARLAEAVLASAVLLASCLCAFAGLIHLDTVTPVGVNDLQPKLRIKGSGWSGIDASTVQVQFLPKLVSGRDFDVTFQDQAMICTLKPKKRWADVSDGVPKTLYVSSVKIGDNNELDEAVAVANVLPTPTVQAGSDKVIYMSATPRLVVNGTNFNTKRTELYFDPPLNEGTDFSMAVVSTTQIVLDKKFEMKWRQDPGPLKLIAINNGGGRLALNPPEEGKTGGGILISEVQADLEGHGITVDTNVDLKIYQSAKTLVVTGSGFRSIEDGGTTLRFGNNLRGAGTNYTTAAINGDQMVLNLVDGSKWRQNAESLPGPLVLLAAEAGAGYVALGPTAAKAGRKVATVYEDPSVLSGDTKLFRTHTHELEIFGSGFSLQNTPNFQFEGGKLQRNVDYIVQVQNSTACKLSLVTSWMPEGEKGPLRITGVDTGAGMFVLPKPVRVAVVRDDSATDESGITITPNNDQVVYQSALKQDIVINGPGLLPSFEYTFSPALDSSGYTLTAEGTDAVRLSLKDGKQWSAYGGSLLCLTVQTDKTDEDTVIKLARGFGIRVATILADPVVTKTELRIYASHTKRFSVQGSGFLCTSNPSRQPEITLDPTLSSDYAVDDYEWMDHEVTLVLKQGSWATVTGDDTVPLKVIQVDTGAGPISMDVEVALVHADSDEVTCEDSCIYAMDGQCDEPGWGGMGGYGWGGYGWSMDDDANMYYDDDGFYNYAGYSSSYYGSSYFGSDDMSYGGIAACEVGTDCSDCGVQVVSDGTCDNTCVWARDGYCDDQRSSGVCAMGTDCQDCGPVGSSNFTADVTAYYTSSWYSDDYSNFLWDDDWLLEGQTGNNQNVYKRTFVNHESVNTPEPGSSEVFMDILWAVVILVGGSVSLGFCMLMYKHFKGGGDAETYLPVQQGEMEMASQSQSSITPDVVRVG